VDQGSPPRIEGILLSDRTDRILASNPVSFSTLCGIPAVDRLIVRDLEARNFRQDPSAPTIILIDAPQGFALHQLEQINRTLRDVIVTTSNYCPEYWEDLWDLAPAVLLVSDFLRGEVEHAIERVANGERYRLVPDIPVRLTRTERVILQYIARGWTTERIAGLRGVAPKTVSNSLTSIYDKLHVSNAVGAALYYWGKSNLLDEISHIREACRA
jgi:DNA-binding NarL/FixJ family response regulator